MSPAFRGNVLAVLLAPLAMLLPLWISLVLLVVLSGGSFAYFGEALLAYSFHGLAFSYMAVILVGVPTNLALRACRCATVRAHAVAGGVVGAIITLAMVVADQAPSRNVAEFVVAVVFLWVPSVVVAVVFGSISMRANSRRGETNAA
ncbi:MAG: hypothetical protein AAF680_00105 [Pseudomonadota bacterium]